MKNINQSEQGLKLYGQKAPVYIGWLPYIRLEAERHGYAIAIHGSLNRDIDIVAIPWVEKPSAPSVLAGAIAEVVGGKVNPQDPNPGEKLHGRLVFTLVGSGGAWLDLSVMTPFKNEE